MARGDVISSDDTSESGEDGNAGVSGEDGNAEDGNAGVSKVLLFPDSMEEAALERAMMEIQPKDPGWPKPPAANPSSSYSGLPDCEMSALYYVNALQQIGVCIDSKEPSEFIPCRMR